MLSKSKKLWSLTLIATIFTIIFAFLPTSEAHILVIGDSNNYEEASKLGRDLKTQGYNVLELYKENATAKNILKGMYDADAVIYAGHGGYMSGNYNGTRDHLNNTIANPPFALVGSDNFIWGIGDQMREEGNEILFTAPFKQNIPVILLHACFSTGWVGDYEVANPIETIYNFASMFTGAGANYYATAWNGAEIVYDFMNGAVDFTDANNNNYENITKSTTYNGTQIWRNDQGYAAFVGDWSAKFPKANETTAYDDGAAEDWYNGNRIKNNLTCKFTISSAPYYINQLVTFTESSSDVNGYITDYNWNFGDGNETLSNIPINTSHMYSNPGTYKVTYTVTTNESKNISSSKTVTVINRNPVANFYLTTSKLVPKVPIGFRSSSYELDIGDNITSYKWNFGDGSTGAGEYVQHTYAKDGRYAVTLTVTDKYGKTSSKSVIMSVITPKPDLVVTKAYKYRGYLYVTVKNQGKATSGTCYTRAWYGRYYKNIYTYGLKPGAYKTYRVYFKYRHGSVKTDYYNRIAESSEGNNIRYF